jgi:hypothetical protein
MFSNSPPAKSPTGTHAAGARTHLVAVAVPFNMSAILRTIVGRCHVGDSNREVLEYAKSRLKPKAWREMPLSKRVTFARLCRQFHAENRDLYRVVMRGV